jgi:hypothetical protein
MPVRSTVHYNDVTNKWHVTMSRQIKVGLGVKREIVRQSFDSYDTALTAISFFWGNA